MLRALAGVLALGLLVGAAVAPADTQDPSKTTRSFRSEPWLHPPIISVSRRIPDPAQGDIFADVQNSIEAGPLILDPSGRLVWFEPLNHAAAFNIEVQQYEGQSVLTYWQGYVSDGRGIGVDLILNHSYQRIATVRAADGLQADLHDFQITPSGDALVTAYQSVRADLRSVGGPRHGVLLDSVIQEIDIATGRLVWQWDAHGHVPISDSYHAETRGKPYDFFHINSIQQLPNGDLLVCARNTFAIYEIDPQTGHVVWTLGGKHSSFKVGPGANFEYQHDAHLQPNGTLTVFNDAAAGGDIRESQSRALVIRLNQRARTARLVRAYTNGVLSQNQGSVQILPDGNTFVGWGEVPDFTEYGRRGHELASLHYPLSMQSYRGYRFPWYGQPTSSPDISVTPTSAGATVYASWNGATDVASWQVLAGTSSSSLAPVGQFPDTAFETKMKVPTTEPYVEVQAMSQSSQVLGTSSLVGR